MSVTRLHIPLGDAKSNQQLERLPVTQEAAGSSPVAPAILIGTGNIWGHWGAGFAQFTAFSQDAKDNKVFEQTKLTMPVMAVGGESPSVPCKL